MVKLLIRNFVAKQTKDSVGFLLKKKRFTVQSGFTIGKVIATVAFHWPKTGGVRAKTCLTGQHDWHLPGHCLMPCIVACTTGKLNSGFGFDLEVHLRNSTKILVMGPHLCTKI